MKEIVIKLLRLFDRKEKQRLLGLLVMMIFAALFETLGIGLIIPFVQLITNPEFIHDNAILSNIYNWFGFHSNVGFIMMAIGMLVIVFIVKNVYLLVFYHTQYKIVLNQQANLSRKLFRSYLTRPYLFHLEQNSASLLRNVNVEVTKVFQGIMMSIFHLATELLVIICILVLLLVANPAATVAASAVLGLSVLTFFAFFRKRISRLGQEQQKINREMIKWVNQGLGASKEVKVAGKEKYFSDIYARYSQQNSDNTRVIRMLDQVPRLFIETVLITVVLVMMLVIILQDTGVASLVSTMALFSLAAFRLMPSINRVVSSITSIRYNQPALTVVYDDLQAILDSSKPRTGFDPDSPIRESGAQVIDFQKVRGFHNTKRAFNHSIRCQQVTFRYPGQERYAIQDMSLTIPIGSSVALIGESGSGKSTLVDIILGLLTPERGGIFVDDQPLEKQMGLWQRKIGYIPQAIFLSDDTIRNNVAFGVSRSEINEDEVWRALEQAHLKSFVESLPEGLETVVGERGVRLSGGQRQRIGIARALYHQPEILFMDEATSALDQETEREVMQAIDGLKGQKTLIIIAHRLSTIENCDFVYKIQGGRLVSAGPSIPPHTKHAK